jgi:hypothetical protein
MVSPKHPRINVLMRGNIRALGFNEPDYPGGRKIAVTPTGLAVGECRL